MKEASLLFSMKDQVSPGLVRMRDANKGFNKSLEETQRQTQQYTQRLDSLIRTQSKLQTSLDGAKRELDAAKKAFKETGTAADSEALEAAYSKYNKIKTELAGVTSAAKDTQRALNNLNEDNQKQSRGIQTTGDDVTSGIFARLGAAGATSMLGDLAAQAVGVYAGSLMGDIGSTYASSMLSSAGMGASIGTAIAPGIGTAIGAALGGLAGLISGKMQEYSKEDDAFKSYVQDSAETVMQERSDAIQRGSSVASQREQDVIAFNQMLGQGVGSEYLEDLRTMAAKTPMEYQDLTSMSRSLATGFGDDPERMLELMQSIGNAGASVGIDASGMNEMAKAMSRMQSSGKATLEYLNIFQERGVDVIGMLSDGLGKSKEELYSMISKGEVDGVAAVTIIQDAMDRMYDGAMEKQSQTFSGLASTLADAQTEMDNAYGEGYNELRKKGMQDQIDWLTGESGQKMQEANKAIGAWYAQLENDKEEFIRKQMDDVLGSEEYEKLMAEGAKGSDKAYAEAGKMLMEAKVRGQNEYNASEGAQLLLQSELSLIETIRNDASANKGYWDAGHQHGLEYSKGLSAAIGAITVDDGTVYVTEQEWAQAQQDDLLGGSGKSHAYGLNRVPYNNYPALLHEGERVLTAGEARMQDVTRSSRPLVGIFGKDGKTQASVLDRVLHTAYVAQPNDQVPRQQSGTIQIARLADQVIVREEADIERIANVFARRLREAMLTGVS